MTTLPQTTPLRLPRPAGGGAMTIPGGVPTTVGSQTGAPGGGMTAGDVWRVIRSNIWLILLFLVVGGVAGFFVNRYLERHHSRFTATGFVQVNVKTGFDPIKGVITDNSSTSLSVEQRTQVQLLNNETLFSEVLQKSPELRDTNWFKQFKTVEEAKQVLQENFSVSPVLESKLIRVQASCSFRDDAKTIVEQIVNAHLARQRQIASDREYQRSMNLKNLQIRYQLKLQEAQREVHEKAVALSLEGNAPGLLSTKSIEVQDNVRKLLDLEQERANAEATLKTIVGALQRNEDPGAVEAAVASDPTIATLKRDVDMLDVAIAEASTKFGKDHPQLVQMQRRRDMFYNKMNSATEEMKAKTRVQVVEAAKSKLDQVKQQLDTVTEQVKTLKGEMGELSNTMALYLTKKDEEKVYTELLKAVNNQLDVIQQMATQSQLGNVDWATPPSKPDRPSFPKLPMTLAVAIGVALALALGIAFLREITDTTVRSPRDISRVGQMNLLGMIPHESDDPQAAGARLPLVIFEAPHSIIAEQLRQVRTRLQHAASLDTTRSILVTSPSPGDGKSTVAANIAAGLALNGRRILLVDANFRRPDMHRIFGIGNEVGFSDVLNNIENFENAVRETQVPNLSILASGPRPSNPTELLESQLLIDFIERALEEYDHVVFDSGPLLFVSESMALAPRVDGVVSVVRARQNSRGVLQRMRDALRQVKAEHLGVILNGVRSQAGGYYGRNVKTYYEYQNTEA